MRTTNYGAYPIRRWALGLGVAVICAAGAGMLTDQFVPRHEHRAAGLGASLLSTDRVANAATVSASSLKPETNATAPAVNTPSVGGVASIGSSETLTLEALIEPARQALQRLQSIHDYSCTMQARERVDGTLRTAQLEVKIREQPFSVYVRHLAPKRLKGTECIYVEGANNGKMLAHTVGLKHRLVGTLALQPDGALAMSEGRYPVTEVGLRRLLERMIRVGEKELPLGNCEVKAIPPQIINGRSCAGIEVVHPEKGDNFLYHIVRVYADPQFDVPVRFESYDWPANEHEEPPLLEEYTYENLQFNPGLTDEDFSVDNPQYDFKRR